MWILEWIMKFHVGNSLFHFMRARATTGGRQPDRFTGLTFVKARRPRALSRRNARLATGLVWEMRPVNRIRQIFTT